MKREHELRLLNLIRGILHRFCPYEKEDAYKFLEELRELETEIKLSKDGDSK